MPFNSTSFAVFFGVVLLGVSLTPIRWRWLLLLVASYAFYASFHVHYLCPVLLLVTAISYGCGLAMAKTASARRRRLIFCSGVFANLLVLAILKYTGFVVQNLAAVLHMFGVTESLRDTNPFVSIGVSFFVFQAISYLVDVFLEVTPAEQHFGFFALHLALFAKLVQGPIERASNLLPQLRQPRPLTWDNVASGFSLFFWGLFKKVVVADRLAVFVGAVYSHVHAVPGFAPDPGNVLLRVSIVL